MLEWAKRQIRQTYGMLLSEKAYEINAEMVQGLYEQGYISDDDYAYLKGYNDGLKIGVGVVLNVVKN